MCHLACGCDQQAYYMNEWVVNGETIEQENAENFNFCKVTNYMCNVWSKIVLLSFSLSEGK